MGVKRYAFIGKCADCEVGTFVEYEDFAKLEKMTAKLAKAFRYQKAELKLAGWFAYKSRGLRKHEQHYVLGTLSRISEQSQQLYNEATK